MKHFYPKGMPELPEPKLPKQPKLPKISKLSLKFEKEIYALPKPPRSLLKPLQKDFFEKLYKNFTKLK